MCHSMAYKYLYGEEGTCPFSFLTISMKGAKSQASYHSRFFRCGLIFDINTQFHHIINLDLLSFYKYQFAFNGSVLFHHDLVVICVHIVTLINSFFATLNDAKRQFITQIPVLCENDIFIFFLLMFS